MKNLTWLVLVMLFASSCNKEEKEIKALKENGIFELKYLKEFAHDYSPDSLQVNTDSFNFLYRSLYLYNALDSSVLFVSAETNRHCLLCISNDSIRIYKEEINANNIETVTWNDIQVLYFDILKKLETESFDSLYKSMNKKYKIRYEYKYWYIGKLEYKGIWESFDKSYFVFFRYNYCIGEMCRFKYEKTIKNDFLPLDKYKIVTPK